MSKPLYNSSQLTKLVIVNACCLILGLIPNLVPLFVDEDVGIYSFDLIVTFVAMETASLSQIFAFVPPKKTAVSNVTPTRTPQVRQSIEIEMTNVTIG